MLLEDQVCSLELAKKLKELGVNQESLWWWCCHTKPAFNEIHFKKASRGDEATAYFSAFTVAELGEIFPKLSILIEARKIRSIQNLWHSYYWAPTGWNCVYFDISTEKDIPLIRFVEKTEADARAKMLIHIIEKGFMNV